MKHSSHQKVTPEALYLSRKSFMRKFGMGLATAAVAPGKLLEAASADESATSYDAITSYNNFYEFTTDKEGVANLSTNFTTSPWELKVEGLVDKPGSYNIPTMINKFHPVERIYRLRCVEGWSMVIPWQGFPIKRLLEEVAPKSSAKYLKFVTVYRPKEMPGQKSSWYSWPYVEGLRLDEAMNDLAILATGIYGKPLLPQNGAPVRLVAPWKYGFKSIKSVVSIELTDKMPTSLWMKSAPNEYGFYANVNPNVSHPRWSQASERRIGEFRRRKTLMFNGYEDQVGDLYSDMDLEKNY